jgi:hypothetical protein
VCAVQAAKPEALHNCNPFTEQCLLACLQLALNARFLGRRVGAAVRGLTGACDRGALHCTSLMVPYSCRLLGII